MKKMAKDAKNQMMCALNCNLSCSMCDDDLIGYLSEWSCKGVNVTEFIRHMEEWGIGPVGKCAICNGNYIYNGNNPRPVVKEEGTRCCLRCHNEIVNPARIEVLNASEDGVKQKRTKKTTNKLKPTGIVNYIRSTGKVKLISNTVKLDKPVNEIYDIISAEYNAPFIMLIQADTDDVITIDERKIFWSTESRGELSILFKSECDHWNGHWRLCADYEEANIFGSRSNSCEPFKPHELKTALLRAAVLEAHLNKELEIDDNSSNKVFVRLRCGQIFHEDGNENSGELFAGYYFEVIIGSKDNGNPNTCVGGIYFPLDTNAGSGLVTEMTRQLLWKYPVCCVNQT
jgi:hypothetical protein